jgi:hypothetical protein
MCLLNMRGSTQLGDDLPSTHDASTTTGEEVVASGAPASSVKAGTGMGDDVEGSSGSSSSP